MSLGEILVAGKKQLDGLTKLAMELWPGHDFMEFKQEFEEMLQTDKDRFLLYVVDGEAVAFMHLSIRTEYVEGADSSPTGYIEGVYVSPSYRRRGISTKLFHEGKKWLVEHGCKQVGSDMEIDNKDSYPFHISLGFQEAGRLITFIRDLD
ncbi:aminoglycoside 6'-N-acetyltransferase [Ornithinibacillus bavariensis]|uniref:aminoglycoside 6'-N-acetyltransferase n=1 Tax=Ornithinibacillus bavariensis TaxID=545502 RepID=UPI000ED6939A|nr:GNAT family N-acetyltransferase [Ornithinibacillus sp.]